jgi:hypothetical protein
MVSEGEGCFSKVSFQAATMYGCVRQLYFLQTRIEKHAHYPNVEATIKSDPDARFLVSGHTYLKRLTLESSHCSTSVAFSGHY